ncbi:class I SAM-dependent methyltransferase [Thalassobaculum salexigens]|uniref:class I SAM-dependent methyltransferase n=1 Tax=Thalassobaculum salexigens TaxID=455360 RepID=UPI00248EE225|nr:class I SAM-dependent methyltransferase [Thalassobaculum salexigens]
MSFSPDWLALRAPYDSAARATGLEHRLGDWLGGRRPVSVVDLGAGSGNNLAHLASRLAVDQRWTLVDADGALLAEAARRHPGVTLHAGDLAGDLTALIPEGTDLVTASALIDLVSQAWLARLADRVREIGCALLVVLTYDGRIAWERETGQDAEIRDLVNRHQRGDKGFGAALGPDAPGALSRLLPGVETASSDWKVGPGETAMRRALVDGWSGAAAEIAPERTESIAAWRAWASSEPRALTVGHTDQLWLPG